MEYVFKRQDVGFCRMYYLKRTSKRLVCFQEDALHKFNLYTCSRDGEPEAKIKYPAALQLGVEQPPQDSEFSQRFAAWVSREGYHFVIDGRKNHANN